MKAALHAVALLLLVATAGAGAPEAHATVNARVVPPTWRSAVEALAASVRAPVVIPLPADPRVRTAQLYPHVTVHPAAGVLYNLDVGRAPGCEGQHVCSYATLSASRAGADDAYYRAYPVDLTRGVIGDLTPSRTGAYPSGVTIRWRLGTLVYNLAVNDPSDEAALRLARSTIANLLVVQRPSSLQRGPARAPLLARRVEPAFTRELPMLRRLTKVPVVLPSGAAARGLTLVNAWSSDDEYSYWLSRMPGISASFEAEAMVSGRPCGGRSGASCGAAGTPVQLGRGIVATSNDPGTLTFTVHDVEYSVEAMVSTLSAPAPDGRANALALRLARSIVVNLP